jgi:hypothetical protein
VLFWQLSNYFHLGIDICFVRFYIKEVRANASKRNKIMKMTRSELANKIADNLDCTAKVWEKDDLIRVYLSHRGKNYGYVAVTNKGLEFALTGYGTNTYGRTMRESAEGVEIKQESFREQMIRTASQPSTKQDSWDAYHKGNPDREYFFGAADEESY